MQTNRKGTAIVVISFIGVVEILVPHYFINDSLSRPTQSHDDYPSVLCSLKRSSDCHISVDSTVEGFSNSSEDFHGSNTFSHDGGRNVSIPVRKVGEGDEYEILKAAHTVDPTGKSLLPGAWVNDPERSMHYTFDHLQCLDQERQGNCHDSNAWQNTTENPKIARRDALLLKSIQNSPGILNASDPWVWESNISWYKVIDYHRRNPQEYQERLRKILENGRKIYLIGDSLTRQWAQTMRCEFMHVMNFSVSQTERRLRFFVDIDTKSLGHWLRQIKKESKSIDYIVLNYGHHVGESKKQERWRDVYTRILDKVQSANYGRIPDKHVLFRTTTVRHFKAGAGDWNTNHSEAGGDAPNEDAQWDWYGGNAPEQPFQNLMAIEALVGPNPNRTRDSTFPILDTAPMMLPRADASFDGSHMCLPGPMQFWSQMLYYRIEQQDKAERAA